MAQNPNRGNPKEVTSDVQRALLKIEHDRRHGVSTPAEFFRINLQASKKALSLALAMDQEKALARKRFGKNYTERNIKPEFRSESALKPKRAKSTLAGSKSSKGFK